MSRGKCEHCALAFGTKKICINPNSREYGEEHRRLVFNRRSGKREMEIDEKLRYCFRRKRKR